MALIVPEECRENPSVWAYAKQMMASNGPISQVIPVDVRQSMANGGGPACLRLRVVADPAAVDPRFMLDEAKADRIASVIASMWPEQIDPQDIAADGGNETLANQVIEAREALLGVLSLDELA
jgi:succinylarginine dihydrolase